MAEVERRATQGIEDTKEATVKSEQAKAEAMRDKQVLTVTGERAQREWAKTQKLETATKKWLQEKYATTLLNRCKAYQEGSGPAVRKLVVENVQRKVDNGAVKCKILVPGSWVTDNKLGLKWTEAKACIGGNKCGVRCSADFWTVIDH